VSLPPWTIDEFAGRGAGPSAAAEVSQLITTQICVIISTVDTFPTESRDVNGSAEDGTGVAEEIDDSGLGPAAMAAIGSVALALYYYYVRGEKQRGQFVGLWPGTILGLATYLKLHEIKQLLEQIAD
jgi:hypothetical protein